jgi:hypothetical protein
MWMITITKFKITRRTNIKVITLNECLQYMESIGYRLDARGLGVFIFRQENRELTLTLSELRAKFNKENNHERSI